MEELCEKVMEARRVSDRSIGFIGGSAEVDLWVCFTKLKKF